MSVKNPIFLGHSDDEAFDKGSVQKPQSRLFAVMGGGTVLCRDFFPLTFGPAACRDGGGVPPFAVIKKSVENWPKNAVFGEKIPSRLPWWGGGVPPFAVIKKSVENWPKNIVF